jgi:hypothetical protein
MYSQYQTTWKIFFGNFSEGYEMKGSIETVNKFSLIFPIEKGGESGAINFSHPPTLLQTNTTCTIGFIDGIHKEEVETPPVFELSLVGVTGVSLLGGGCVKCDKLFIPKNICKSSFYFKYL